jgi:hypothetical protein
MSHVRLANTTDHAMSRFAVRIAAAVLGSTLVAGAALGSDVPWAQGDPAPPLAGVHLGDSREAVEQALGAAGELKSRGEGEYEFVYPERGVHVFVSDKSGVTAVAVAKRSAGDIDGFRVGDDVASVRRKWGEPDTGGLGLLAYDFAGWRVSFQGDAKGRIVVMGVGVWPSTVATPPVEEPQPITAAPGGIPQLKGTLNNGNYLSPDGSLRFRLPLPAASDTEITERIDRQAVSVRVSSKSLRLFFGVMKLNDVHWGSTKEYAQGDKRLAKGVTQEWVSSSLGAAWLTRFVAESPGPMLRSAEYVVIRDHAEYMAYYNLEDGGSRRADPQVGAFASLDDMLRDVFDSIEVKGAKR